jgi:hypothetical protein
MQKINQINLEEAIGKTIEKVLKYDNYTIIIKYTDDSFSCYTVCTDYDNVQMDSTLYDYNVSYKRLINYIRLNPNTTQVEYGLAKSLWELGIINEQQFIEDAKIHINNLLRHNRLLDKIELDRLRKTYGDNFENLQ